MQLDKMKYTIEEIENFGKYFEKGHTIKETADKFKIPYGSMKNYLTKFGYRKPNRKVKVKENLTNPDYFEDINTHEKAYFLGLLLSDGSIHKGVYSTSMSIGLQLEDKYILEELKKELGSDVTISEYKNSAKITITNEKIINDLINLNFCENKSSANFLTPDMSREFLNSFILGYFDGDGCITIKTSGAIVVSICCSSKIFLEDLQIKMKSFNIDTRLNVEKKGRKNPLYVLYLKGRKNQLLFKNIMYKDSSYYLERKYEKFKEIPC